MSDTNLKYGTPASNKALTQEGIDELLNYNPETIIVKECVNDCPFYFQDIEKGEMCNADYFLYGPENKVLFTHRDGKRSPEGCPLVEVGNIIIKWESDD
jgi:hypothetical protein